MASGHKMYDWQQPLPAMFVLCFDGAALKVCFDSLFSVTFLQVLNDTYSDELRRLVQQDGRPASDAQFISIDRLGADVRARFGTDCSVERVGFDQVCSRHSHCCKEHAFS